MDIKELLKKMSLEQKLAQLSQYNAICLHIGASGDITGPAQELELSKEQISSVGSVLNFVGAKEMIEIQKEHLENDPNKIPMLFMHDVVHGYKTIYPIPLALGATFDTEIVEACCDMAAKEMAAGGVHVTFAPMVDLVRDPRWGRCMETTGEDTYLNSEMARAMVRGFQKSSNVAACVKHFAAYGQAEAGRDYNTTDISERTLRDFYLPAYQAAVDEGVEMVMTSFNILNGVPSSGNKWLVKNVLREEWGFDKIVISDYNAFREMQMHGYCETEADCAEKAIHATSDIEMMSACYLQNIPKLIAEGKVSEQQIDEAVLRVLRLKQQLGLFEKPYLLANEEEETKICLCTAHREMARTAAEKSAVLLKNENVLPFRKDAVKKIAVLGPFADRVMLGSWSCHGKEEDGVSVLQGVRNLLPNLETVFSQGCGDKINEFDNALIAEAVEKAKESDAVILCVGERSDMSGESMSRAELRLSKAQRALIKEVVKVNKNTAIVLFCGRPLVLTDILDEMPALVVAWQPGTEGGNAIVNLLFGMTNFSGRLPMTFPRSEGQIPIYYNSYRTGRPWEAPYGSWYQDMPNSPLFPFGYGLSYSTFSLSKPAISATELRGGETLEISVTVENTGTREGETTLQLYLCDEHASLVRPVKELKGYQKITLKPNERKKVLFVITEEMLKFWSANGRFEAEDGWFTVWVANSSEQMENGARFLFKK